VLIGSTMRRHRSTIALLLVVALAAAGGGYALGTQSGDGGAAAAARPHHRLLGHALPRVLVQRRHHRLVAVAHRLGVEPARLREALRTVRQRRREARLHALAGELAPLLGLPESRVESALQARRRGP
jgi:hypothetical protein